MNSNRTRSQALIVSAVLGALAGIGVGLMLLRRAEERGDKPTLTAGEGVSLGLMVLGLLRQVAQLDEGE